MSDQHVYPLNDLREHITDGPGCPCEPRIEVISANLIYVHNSWDHREIVERAIDIMNGEGMDDTLKDFRGNEPEVGADGVPVAISEPCPFCDGDNSAEIEVENDWAVMCLACGSTGPIRESRATAIVAWNYRPSANRWIVLADVYRHALQDAETAVCAQQQDDTLLEIIRKGLDANG